MSPQFKMQAAQRLPLIISRIYIRSCWKSCQSCRSLFFFGYHIHQSKFGSTTAWNEIPNEKKRAPRRIWRCTRQPKTFDHPGAGSPTKQKTKGCKANKMAGLIYIYFSPCSRFNFVNLVLGLVEYRKSMKTETNKLLTANRTSEKKKKKTKKTIKISTNPSYFLALGYGFPVTVNMTINEMVTRTNLKALWL